MQDIFRKWLAVIQDQLSNLDRNQKLLISSLAVILAMILFLVVQYAASPERVALLHQTLSDEERAQVITYLDDHNVDYQLDGELILVSPEDQAPIYAKLSINDKLPTDISDAFDKLLENQDWWSTSSHNEQKKMIAYTQQLTDIIKNMPGVANAAVTMDKSSVRPIGHPHARPTASVTLFMENGKRVDQNLVKAIARMTSGAVAGMAEDGVSVIDANLGRSFKAGDDFADMGGDINEQRLKLENHYRDKIFDVARIPNLVVGVTVALSRDRVRSTDRHFKEKGEGTISLLGRAESEASSSQDTPPGGEPGVGPNTTASINTGSQQTAGTATERERTRDELDHGMGVHEVHRDKRAGEENNINVVINVPRSYLEGVHRMKNGLGPDDAISDDDLKPTEDAELARINSIADGLLKDHAIAANIKDLNINAKSANVTTTFYYDMPLAGATPEVAANAGFIASTMGYRTLALSALAVISVLLMIMMVRKVGQQQKRPSIHELAGIPAEPPVIPDAEELVEEVAEASAVLEGIEVDEETLRREKVKGQVQDLIRNNPEDAAMLLTRWAESGANVHKTN